jgi:hypothetical protein
MGKSYYLKDTEGCIKGLIMASFPSILNPKEW